MRAICVGEAMIELSFDREGRQIDFAGDVFNTAVYLAREAQPSLEVDFVTVLGSDPISDRMEARFRAEGLSTARIRRHPDRLPGIYAIALDARGERSFTYWRDRSAARTLFEDGFGALDGAALIYLSGITLAILSPERRAALIDQLAAHPARIAFDSNYRPQLWPDATTARRATEAAWAVTDIALPSLDDEMTLFGDADAAAVLARLRGYGLRQGALKRGAAGPLALAPEVTGGPYPPAETVVDTTAAGDSFNGAFLAAILAGQDTAQAMARGHAMAARVVGFPGAIMPADAPGD